jgi:hypothetical protein
VSGRRKQEREGDPPAPGGIEWDLDDAAALVGMDEALGLCDDAAVLGDGARAHPEQKQRARDGPARRQLDHHEPRRLR